VFGDSLTWHLLPAFDEIGRTHGMRVLVLVRSACPSATVAVWSEALRRADTECDDWREQALLRIEEEQPAVVVLANSNSEILIGADGERFQPWESPDGPHSTLWKAGLAQTLSRLESLDAPVFVIGQPPHPTLAGLDPPVCLAAHPADFQRACRGARSSMIDRYTQGIDQEATAGTEAAYVDPTPWFCDPSMCPAVIDRNIVYRDLSGHLTAPFAFTLAARLAHAIGLTDE